MNQLSFSLRNFGLNPIEWDILRLQGSDYLVRHKYEEGFEFKGEVEFKDNGPRWKFLRLWSI